LLRWAFGRGSSLIARPPRPGSPQEYGLLIPVASPRDSREAEAWRTALEAAGVRATLAETVDGPRLLVFAVDESRARDILAS
jgi:hypothetical protein